MEPPTFAKDGLDFCASVENMDCHSVGGTHGRLALVLSAVTLDQKIIGFYSHARVELGKITFESFCIHENGDSNYTTFRKSSTTFATMHTNLIETSKVNNLRPTLLTKTV